MDCRVAHFRSLLAMTNWLNFIVSTKLSAIFRFKMNTLLSTFSASVSELKKNPSQLIEESEGESIAILNHNKPTAYLVPAEKYERMMEELDDLNISRIIHEREEEKKLAKEVSLDDL
tara:strand:- start:4419 stop:4769 length:351 start_codon:yes stop_codon:yes gene_type:complete